MTTNAQAALQAAATVFSGGRGHTAPADVKGMAASFKNWLDYQDRDAASTPTELVDGVQLSHHISCASRRSSACTCHPVPYTQLPPGGIGKGDVLWVVDMQPRNLANAAVLQVEVWAPNEQEALSKAISAKPGHKWGRVRRASDFD